METVENDFMKFWMHDGIMYSDLKFPTEITLDKVKGLIETRHKISNKKKQYWCYISKGVKSYPKEARDYSDIHGQDYLHACAAVVSSQITMFIFNAFTRINRPRIPFRAFKTKESAVAWLKQLKAENEAKGIY